MMDESTPLGERESIEALLPWYATGRLDAADRARVEAYLARHPEMRRQIALVEADRDAVVRANQAIAAPRSLTAERLVAGLPSSRASVLATMTAALRGLLTAPSPSAVRWAAAAAVALLLGQAAVIGILLRAPAGPGYETASGERAGTPAAATVLVRFQPTAGIDAITAALAARDMRIVDGPKPGRLYVVAIGPADLSDTDRARQEAALRDLGNLVAVVLPQAR